MNFLIAWNFIKAVWFVFARFFGKKPTGSAPDQIGIAPKIAAVAIVLLIVAAFGMFVKNCRVAQRVAQTADEVGKSKTKTLDAEAHGEVLEKKQEVIESEQNKLRQKSVQTDADYRDARNRDSDTRNGNFSVIKKSWCQSHKDDSKCREYFKQKSGERK